MPKVDVIKSSYVKHITQSTPLKSVATQSSIQIVMIVFWKTVLFDYTHRTIF